MDVKQTLVRRLARATGTIEAMPYCFDSVDLSKELAAAVRRGVSVRLIVDRNKFYDPPGARQIEQLDLLVSWRVEVRILTPENHPHAAQHSKTWLLDRSVYACGSANGTENSLHRCIEVVMWTSDEGTCQAAASDFERWWAEAKPVTSEDMAAVRAKKGARRSPSAQRADAPRGAAAASSARSRGAAAPSAGIGPAEAHGVAVPAVQQEESRGHFLP